MNRAKLKALVHYVIAKSDPSRLGSIRLNKIVWFADTFFYRRDGASITGEQFVKRQHGPVPMHILNILRDLEQEDKIIVRDRQSVAGPMRDLVSLSAPDTTSLSADEIAIIEDVRSSICGSHTAMSISELSHDQIWEAAEMGEEIPLAATLASVAGVMTADVTKWADSCIGRYEAAV